MSTESDLISPAQAGRIIGVSEHEARRLCRAGRLPAVRIGRQWIIRRGDALAYVRGPMFGRGPKG